MAQMYVAGFNSAKRAKIVPNIDKAKIGLKWMIDVVQAAEEFVEAREQVAVSRVDSGSSNASREEDAYRKLRELLWP